MLVAQLFPILCNPMDCSPPGSSLHGIFPTQGLNPSLLHCWQILYCLSHQGSLLVRMGVKCGSDISLLRMYVGAWLCLEQGRPLHRQHTPVTLPYLPH